VQCQHRLEDVGVLLPVEVRRTQEVADLEDGIRIDQDGAQDTLLGLDRLWRQLLKITALGGGCDRLFLRSSCRGRGLQASVPSSDPLHNRLVHVRPRVVHKRQVRTHRPRG
jgi:hypothetical protein